MLRFVADENFKGSIVRGLRRRHLELDIARVQDVGLTKTVDPVVLAWAAEEGRLLLTHDARTITRFAYDRVRAGLPMPGVVEVRQGLSVGLAIEEILMLAECSAESEWEGQIIYLPLR